MRPGDVRYHFVLHDTVFQNYGFHFLLLIQNAFRCNKCNQRTFFSENITTQKILKTERISVLCARLQWSLDILFIALLFLVVCT